MSTMLDEALSLSALGLSPIPNWRPRADGCDCGKPGCRNAGKHPALAWEPYEKRPPTEDEVRAWFGNGSRFNIGIVCGKSGRVVCVDLDTREAVVWATAHLPQTEMRTATHDGREHWYYQHPGGDVEVSNRARIRTGDPAVKIDVRGDGGQAVVPPSLHATGATYQRLGSWPAIDTLPVFNPAWLEMETPKAAATAPPRTTSPSGRDLDRARAYLHEVPGAIEGQGGDQHTFVTACRLVRDFGLNPGDARMLLAEWNRTCQPPWTDADLDAKIDRALKYGSGPIGSKLHEDRPGWRHAAPDADETGAGQPEAETGPRTATAGLPVDALADAVDVAAEGQRIEREGIPYTVDGLIVALGMLAFLVAFAKVGKTTFAQALAAAVAMGRRFLNRATTQARVLVVAAEDPPEYVAWLARHLNVERGWLTFYRGPILLSADGLAQIVATVKAGGYGLVLIASWQAVIRGLVTDENDNAGAVCVVEAVKAAARATGVPWLIDAHSGKGEDQTDDADPSKAMRGASAAAGAADYTLSLRYANGAFGTQRKLSGRGRFVSLAPMTIDFDAATSEYTLVADHGKDAATETTWRLIREMGALTTNPESAGAIARAVGLVGADGHPTSTHKRQVGKALAGRPEVLRSEESRRGGKTTLYRLASEVADA
jgi:hypothetical protein